MENNCMIEKAVQRAKDYFDTVGISITKECLREEAEDWFNGGLTLDDIALAAAVVTYGGFRSVSLNEILDAVESIFPEEYYSELYFKYSPSCNK